MYRPNKDDAFYYSLKFLHYLHYYPSENEEKNLKLYQIVSLLIRVFSSFVWVECAIHCTVSIKNRVPVDISEDIVGLTGVGNSMLVCIFFELNVKGWSRLFIDITDTQKFGTPPKLTQVIKRANREVDRPTIDLIDLIDDIVKAHNDNEALVIGCNDPTQGRCERLNQEKGLHEICGTVTPLWWPNEEISPITKSIFMFCQVFSAVFYIPPSAILIFVPWEAAEVIISKIDHLKDLFENAFDTEDKDLRIRRLKFCIQYHQEIIRMTEELNKATKRVGGQLSFVAAVILSCIGTQMLKEYSIGAVIHLMGYAVAVFLVCQTGQKIRDETYDIQDAVYASAWYEVDPYLTKDMQLVLLRCQKPVYMEAMPFGIFNYNLLIVIIKTSYSYLTLINKTTDEVTEF